MAEFVIIGIEAEDGSAAEFTRDVLGEVALAGPGRPGDPDEVRSHEPGSRFSVNCNDGWLFVAGQRPALLILFGDARYHCRQQRQEFPAHASTDFQYLFVIDRLVQDSRGHVGYA